MMDQRNSAWLRIIILVGFTFVFTLSAEAQSKFVGRVNRTTLSTRGLSADLNKFWGKTVYPKRKHAQVTILDDTSPNQALVGMTSTMPVRYEDAISLTKTAARNFRYSGEVPADSNWTRRIVVRIKKVSAKKIEFEISETDINSTMGYRLRYTYKGTLKKS